MRRREFFSLLGGAGAIVAVVGTVAAQQIMPGLSLHPDTRPLTPEEKEKQKAIDDAYRSTLEKLPDKKKSADPWGNMRSTTTTSSRQWQQ